MGQALSRALKSPVILPFVGFSSIPKSLFLRIFLHSHTPFTLFNLLASYQPVLGFPAHIAWLPCRMESRSELLKKDMRVKRKVSGNSHEVISYLLLPQQATAGKNFLFPYSDDVYLLNAAYLQEFTHGPSPEKTVDI